MYKEVYLKGLLPLPKESGCGSWRAGSPVTGQRDNPRHVKTILVQGTDLNQVSTVSFCVTTGLTSSCLDSNPQQQSEQTIRISFSKI